MSSRTKTSKPVKKRKVEFGQPTQDDSPTAQSQSNLPSATAWSTRRVHRPTLTQLCIQVFARTFTTLHEQGNWESLKAWLSIVPATQVPRLFAALRATCPTRLSNTEIMYFLRGSSITLTDDLPGVNKFTLKLFGEPVKMTLRELHLIGLDKIADDAFASMVSNLTFLQILNLRGCTKVGPKTAAAVAKTCEDLVTLNLNHTSVMPASLAPVLRSCPLLEVLKVAGVPNWTDATVAKLWTELDSTMPPDARFPNLKSLKLRQTAVTDAVINQFLLLCSNLRRLDVSFTSVKHPPLLLSNEDLEKLSLTSTRVANSDLIQILTNMRSLRSLALGALGGGRGLAASISNTSAMTLSDQALREITDIIVECRNLEKVSLVGNTKLGMTSRHDGALADFMRRVGRKCLSLNVAGISSLRSSDLGGLVPVTTEDGPSRLKTLILNNTSVDDGAIPFISSCADLQVLELASTKISSEGLFPAISACEQLEQLNLTSCRGIGVVDRRHFFKVWEVEGQSQ